MGAASSTLTRAELRLRLINYGVEWEAQPDKREELTEALVDVVFGITGRQRAGDVVREYHSYARALTEGRLSTR